MDIGLTSRLQSRTFLEVRFIPAARAAVEPLQAGPLPKGWEDASLMPG